MGAPISAVLSLALLAAILFLINEAVRGKAVKEGVVLYDERDLRVRGSRGMPHSRRRSWRSASFWRFHGIPRKSSATTGSPRSSALFSPASTSR